MYVLILEMLIEIKHNDKYAVYIFFFITDPKCFRFHVLLLKLSRFPNVCLKQKQNCKQQVQSSLGGGEVDQQQSVAYHVHHTPKQNKNMRLVQEEFNLNIRKDSHRESSSILGLRNEDVELVSLEYAEISFSQQFLCTFIHVS